MALIAAFISAVVIAAFVTEHSICTLHSKHEEYTNALHYLTSETFFLILSLSSDYFVGGRLLMETKY